MKYKILLLILTFSFVLAKNLEPCNFNGGPCQEYYGYRNCSRGRRHWVSGFFASGLLGGAILRGNCYDCYSPYYYYNSFAPYRQYYPYGSYFGPFYWYGY